MSNDLISRQAAIEAIEMICNTPLNQYFVNAIKRLPSEQPEIIRCEDCKWFDISEPSGTVEPIGYRCKRRWIFVDADDFCKFGEVRKE